MKENFINFNSKAIDIFRDNDFLRLFRVFILEYVIDNLEDEKIFKLYNEFRNKNYLEYFKEKNSYNLFRQFEKFFSDSTNLTIFLEFLRKYNIDKKLLNIFLETGEFLEKVSINNGEYPKEFYSISSNYNTKIIDIIGKKDLENPKFILAKNGYSLISPFNFEIIEVDFGNGIDYQTLNGINRFIWCKDSQNNIFYQNSFGEILVDGENKIIKHIYNEDIKTFGENRVFQFIDEENKSKIQIENNLSFGTNFEDNITIEGNSFYVKKISYIEDFLDKDENIRKKQEELEILVINTNKGNILFNTDFKEVTILDLLEFLHKNNPLTFDTIKKTLSRLSEISIDDIYNIYNFNGVKFLELEADLDSHLYDEDEIEPEIKHFMIFENGKVLLDKNEKGEFYIRSLGEKKEFLGKEFVSFSLTQEKKIDGYIDSFGKVVKIGNIKLLNIEKIPFLLDGKKYYKLNNKKNLIFSENYVKKELSKYDGFNENGNKFEVVMEDGENINFKNGKYEKLVGILKDSGEINFYLQYGEYKKEVEYKKLLEELRKNEVGNRVLKLLNQTLNMLGI